MAKTTISHELAAKYPEFKGRFGETVDTSEVQSVLRAHGDAPTVGEQVAAKKARTATPAPAPAPTPAPAPAKRARAPRKTAPAKKTR